MAFAPGQTVGEYEILSVLGTGGMGRVYRVRNVISNRVEAMKVLLPDFTAEPDLAARFIAEIRTLASLDHPNIAQLHTAFQMENQLVMMMEFVEGFTLEQRAKQGPLPSGDIIEYTLQILAALSYAHSHGVVHRDIKPANVMVTAHGVVKLTDFGIAKSRTDNQLTQPGTTLGSVYYMSPEQVRGGSVDARSDLYSVGILLYELLSGRRPFEGDTTFGVLNQQLNAAPRPPVEVNPLLPQQLNDLILLALAKDPAQRFQSADAFRNALSHFTGKKASPGVEQAASTQTVLAAFPPAASPSTPSGSSAGTGGTVPWSAVNSVPAAQRTPPRAGSQRALWVSIGALTVVALLAAAAVFLPRFLPARASASASKAGSSPTSESAPPAQQTSASTPALSPESTPAASAAPETGTGHPAAAAQPRLDGSRPNRSPSRPAYTPGTPLPPVSAPQGLQPSSGLQSAPQPPPPAAPSAREFEQARDRKIQLDSRAAAVSSSLDNLRRQQEADGYGIRQDIAGAASRMQTYLRTADADLNSGDISAAQHDMDRADKEISTLEAFFNR